MIKLNLRNVKLLQAEREITGYELSKMAGITLTRLNNLFGGAKVMPSDIVGMLKAFPELRFEDLFIIE